MYTEFDGKKLSDLNFSTDRIKELQSHVQGAGSDHGAFGYSAKTEHHFQELDDPTKSGSIEADMRAIGKHLGYEHAGTLNHDKVRDFIMQEEETPSGPEIKIEEITKPDSERLATAKERVQEYENEMWNGKHAEKMFAPSVDPQGFLEKYKTNFAKNQQTANKGMQTPPSLRQKED